MDYIKSLKEQPEVYEALAKVASKYVGDVAKERAFPTGEEPSRDQARKLLVQANISLDNESLDALLHNITEDIFMKRGK